MLYFYFTQFFISMALLHSPHQNEIDWGNDKVAKLVNVHSHFGWKEEHQEYE